MHHELRVGGTTGCVSGTIRRTSGPWRRCRHIDHRGGFDTDGRRLPEKTDHAEFDGGTESFDPFPPPLEGGRRGGELAGQVGGGSGFVTRRQTPPKKSDQLGLGIEGVPVSSQRPMSPSSYGSVGSVSIFHSHSRVNLKSFVGAAGTSALTPAGW